MLIVILRKSALYFSKVFSCKQNMQDMYALCIIQTETVNKNLFPCAFMYVHLIRLVY